MLSQFKYLLTSSCQFKDTTPKVKNEELCDAWSVQISSDLYLSVWVTYTWDTISGTMQCLVSSNIFWHLPVNLTVLHNYKMQNQKPCTAWSAHVRCSIRNSGMLSQFKSLNYDDWNENLETATHDAQSTQSIIPTLLHARFSILHIKYKIRNYLNLNLNHAMLGQSELLMTKMQNQGLCNVQCSIKRTN